MGLDIDTLAKGALIAVGLLAFLLSWRRRSPARGGFTLQVGDTTHEVAYVVRGGQVHVTSAGRRASTPLRPDQDPAQVAADLVMAMYAGGR